MFDATREKTRLWLLILVGVVATLLGQTHAREIFVPSPHESGVFAAQTQATTGENLDACRYDVPDSLLAAKTTPFNPTVSTSPAPHLSPTAAPQRIQGPWTTRDIARAQNGQGPLDFVPTTNRAGREVPLELHHADQMPGSAIHEVPPYHSNIPGAHPNKFNQGVTPTMRTEDAQLHWYFRVQEMGY